MDELNLTAEGEEYKCDCKFANHFLLQISYILLVSHVFIVCIYRDCTIHMIVIFIITHLKIFCEYVRAQNFNMEC